MFEVRPVALPFMSHVMRRPRVAKGARPAALSLRRAGALVAVLGVGMVVLSSCDEASTTGTSTTEGKVSAAAPSRRSVSPAPGLSGNPGERKFEPGSLTFEPASGPTTNSPNWTTKDTCPAGHNASAELVAFNLQGDFESRISLPISGPGPYRSAPGAGVLDFNLNSVRLYGTPDVGADGTIVVAVGCYADGAGLGSAVFVQSIFVHYANNGATYSTSSTN
jgi:hypothetical protein